MSDAIDRLEEEMAYDRALEAKYEAAACPNGFIDFKKLIIEDIKYRQAHPLEEIDHSENDNRMSRREAILHKVFDLIVEAEVFAETRKEANQHLVTAKNLLRKILDERYWAD
jgi:hypothetical protein